MSLCFRPTIDRRATKSLQAYRFLIRVLMLLCLSCHSHSQAPVGVKSVGPRHVSDPVLPVSDRKFALVIGVGDYPRNGGFAALRYSEVDAKRMGEQLQRLNFEDVEILLDRDASKEIVLRKVAELSKKAAGLNGLILLYFSGHGFEVDGTNYLAAHDSTVNNLSGTGVSVNEIRSILAKGGSRRQLLLIDACRANSTAGAKSGDSRGFADFNRAEGIWILNSTRPGGVSFEDTKLEHGVFTHFLLRGLQGDAAGPDGIVTFRDLAAFVSTQVAATTRGTVQEQIPFVGGDASADFYIARPVAAPAKPPVSLTLLVLANELQGVLNTKDGLHYSWIAPGTFDMGCRASDTYCDDDENPRHSVSISKGFWIGQVEVTRLAYRRFVVATGRQMPPTPPFRQTDEHPVVGVTWVEADAFCRWAGGNLPSEAEWEYALSRKLDGNQQLPISDLAWFADNSGNSHLDSATLFTSEARDAVMRLHENGGGTHPAGRKAGTADSVFDLLGNVTEWCRDWFGPYSRAESDNPAGPTRGQFRVLRGGAWNSPPTDVRATKRFHLAPTATAEWVGFRCVGQKPFIGNSR